MCSTRSTIRRSSPTAKKKTRGNREVIMDGFVATKLDEFERGKISRRRLIETLTLAATTAYAAEDASAQKADPKLKIALINHISYTVPNFRQAGDWFSKVFNLEQSYVRSNRSEE